MDVLPDTWIEAGDLVFLDDDYTAKPAAMAALSEFLPVVEAARFAARFLGVARVPSPIGDRSPIVVSTAGVWEFPAVEVRRWRVGEWLAAAVGQQLARTCRADYAIARVASSDGQPIGRVTCQIVSAIMDNGIQPLKVP